MPITYLVGDATLPQGDGLRLIAHIVSDAFVPWQATIKPTFAKALGQRYPEAEADYRIRARTHPAIGTVFITIIGDLHIVHMLAQRGLRSASNPVPLDTPGLNRCLSKLFQYATQIESSVHMPRIGAGFAGWRWRNIEPLIAQHMGDVPVFVYDLPKKETT